VAGTLFLFAKEIKEVIPIEYKNELLLKQEIAQN